MENEANKKYLSVPKKIAYGSGDFGSNFFYMLVSSFMMLYLTDSVGLNAGVVGTLMMVSKLLDGVTDVFFGSLIDKTHSKMGKARPWMFFSAIPLAISTILLFCIPESLGITAQYAYFFVFYTLSNAVFYTANNIAYATMSARITKNDAERVSLGSFRYAFAVVASIIVSAMTVILVDNFGGGAAGWRMVAIIYMIIMFAFSSIASLVCKEIPEEEFEVKMSSNGEIKRAEKKSFLELLKIIITNKYYLIMLAIYILSYINTGIGTTSGTYYFKYIMENPAFLGVVSMSSMVMIVGLIFNPSLVKKYGMYKVNLVSYIITAVLSVGVMIASYMVNFTGIVVLMFLKAVTMAPLMGSLNALVAEVAKNVYLKKNVQVEGMMFSCSSLGMKLGSGIGSAAVGWILAAAGYVGTSDIMSAGVISAIKFIYGALPLIVTVLLVVMCWLQKVVEENQKLVNEK